MQSLSPWGPEIILVIITSGLILLITVKTAMIKITVSAPTTIMSDGLSNILSAMIKKNVKIVSVCLSSNYYTFYSDFPTVF